ncbi:MAG: hypothetical protein HY611_00865 [Elusimicrobia bacterium]|nr:hypothetical protein [Elusimicrobiota bacterium]
MRYSELPSYARSLRSIRDLRRLEAIHQTVSHLIACFEKRTPPSQGLGLKKLRGHIWEIRSSLQDRVLFSWKGDLVVFLVAGTHEDIKRSLK